MAASGRHDPDPQLVADVFARDCSSRTILGDVVSTWGTLALLALGEGPYRFNALRRRVDGISEKMLAQTLRTLERDGFVVRDVQATIPPKVEYALTPAGAAVAEQLLGLVQLVEASVDGVAAARATYDAAAGIQPQPLSTSTS